MEFSHMQGQKAATRYRRGSSSIVVRNRSGAKKMRNIEMLSSNGPVDDERIRLFELTLGVELPSSYRNWMCLNNGGYPSRSNNFIQKDRFEPPLRCSVGIESFLSLHEIPEARNVYRNRISSDLMPIADDGDGNYLCIAILGEERGAVFFWDHECESAAFELLGENAYSENKRKIAENFDELLMRLEREPGYADEPN